MLDRPWYALFAVKFLAADFSGRKRQISSIMLDSGSAWT
jgi:hypothetical protein